MLTFSANMVSSNSQAVWCALYKQSPGDQGWQVLGMINNYQSDAGEEDDRDSGSLTVLTSLEEGDQVWVEWRGYGRLLPLQQSVQTDIILGIYADITAITKSSISNSL